VRRSQATTIRLVRRDQPLLTAAELDRMTPDARAAALAERVVTDLDILPDDFRQRVVETGERLAAQRRVAPA
jgi:hypothetical protein